MNFSLTNEDQSILCNDRIYLVYDIVQYKVTSKLIKSLITKQNMHIIKIAIN